MNDIFVLYKQSGTNKLVDTFRKGMTKHFTEKDFTIRDYDDTLPDESCYESTRSFILLCLIDDEWFYDPYCRTIWKYFWEKQTSCNEQILFPVLVENVNTDNFDDTKKDIYNNAAKLGFYNITNNDSKEINELYTDVITSLNKVGISSNYTPRGIYGSDNMGKTNVHAVYDISCSSENSDSWISQIAKCNCEISCNKRINNLNEIILRLKSALNDRLKLIKDEQRSYPNGEKVCVLYTGGTAGMIFDPFEKESLELKQADLSELIINLPRLKREKFEIDFYSFEPALDSSNIGSEHWLLMAAVLEILWGHYHGFVIIHGANTMAYTASAISFLFDGTVNKPIILTGSELALTERNSDAEQNIHKSIEIASQRNTTDIQGVCVLFGKWLLKGNRTTKQIALDKTEGFYSPNYPEIASVTSDKVIVDLAHLKKDRNLGSFHMNKFISSTPKVAICDIYPDMDMNAFAVNCTSKDVKAVILRTYGTGGVPDQNKMFRECIEELQKRDTIVINLTQCPKGTSEFRLFETNEMLFNYGVISGGDMVTEAAYCKLKHLFSKFSAVDNHKERMQFIRHYMMVSIQDEMSRSMFVIPVTISVDCNNIDTNGRKFYLNAGWSSNPAINRVPDQDLSLDDFARLDENKDIIESAVLRLGKVSVATEKTKDIHLKIKVSIFSDGEDENIAEDDFIIHSTRLSNAQTNEYDINIDILEIAKKHLKPKRSVTILVKTEAWAIRIGYMKILLSTTRR